MNENPYTRLLALLERLDGAKIPYTLSHSRTDAVMICAFAPGEYWEIEYMEDGSVDIERYRSDGKILDESALGELFQLCSDDEEAVTTHDATARS